MSISVTLAGKNNKHFEGFALRVRSIKGDPNNVVGTLTLTSMEHSTQVMSIYNNKGVRLSNLY